MSFHKKKVSYCAALSTYLYALLTFNKRLFDKILLINNVHPCITTGCHISYWSFSNRSKSKQGFLFMILSVKHVQKVWQFDFRSLVSYVILKLCVKWTNCFLLNQVVDKL